MKSIGDYFFELIGNVKISKKEVDKILKIYEQQKK